MKKILLILLLIIFLPSVFGDTMPFYMDNIPQNSLGVFQVSKEFNIYHLPDANLFPIKKYNLEFNPETMPDNMFAVLINEKQLGMLYVTDIGDDNWLEVLYNKTTGQKGWTNSVDRMQFLPWINFYNLYGRKYGLRMLKDTPKDLYVLRSRPDDLAQPISKLNYIRQIKLTKISGNWALVSVFDLDDTPKTGWLKWRNSDGKIYAFPNVN